MTYECPITGDMCSILQRERDSTMCVACQMREVSFALREVVVQIKRMRQGYTGDLPLKRGETRCKTRGEIHSVFGMCSEGHLRIIEHGTGEDLI